MTNNKLLFSIIVPVYNIEKYINKCLDSLITQTYKNIEIILVDDGSTDECGKICDEYVTKDNRIKVIHKKNGGQGSARNKGLQIANGDYVVFVDGDDFIPKNAIEVLAKCLESNNYDILCFDLYQMNNGIVTGRLMPKIFNDVENDRKHIILNPSPCARTYKLEFLKKNNIFFKEGIIYEDLALIPTLSNYTKNIKFIYDCLYYYVLRENSTMNAITFKENRDDKFIALESMENGFKKNNNFEKYKNEIEYLYIKHLLIVYSTEILKYRKEIYKPRIERALKTVNNKFPDWFHNVYLKREPLQTKVYLMVLKYRMYSILVFMNKIFSIAKKKR